jgi:hypothetical protein
MSYIKDKDLQRIFKSGFYARQYKCFEKKARSSGETVFREEMVVFFCIRTFNWGRRRIAKETSLTEHKIRKIIQKLKTPDGTPLPYSKYPENV